MLSFSGPNPPKLHEIVERLVRNSFKKKKNFFMLIVGAPGSGKSYTALKFAETIELNFSPREQIIYMPEQFKQVFENLEESKKKVLIFDEAHVTMPSRRWFSFVNLSINTIMSTFRQVKQLAVFSLHRTKT
jgi:ATPase family associated with various cellular activities (AAA).